MESAMISTRTRRAENRATRRQVRQLLRQLPVVKTTELLPTHQYVDATTILHMPVVVRKGVVR